MSMNTRHSRRGGLGRRGLVAAIATLAMLSVTLVSPADAANRRVFQVDEPIGFFYGTFEADDNYVMVVGGPAEAFCEEYPEDPFLGAPGSAKALVIENADGSGEVRVESFGQPLFIYESGPLEAPPFIYSFCDAYFAGEPTPEPFAEGTAKLKVRDQWDANGNVQVFNQARGRVLDAEGNQYYVHGSADFEVIGGELQGNPADFVDFEFRRFPRK